MPKSCFRYPGGKSKVADKILKYMPAGTQEYREAFVGGGGVFFNLAPNKVKTRWINDINSGLIAVYTAFRDRPDDFIKKCRDIEPPRTGEEEVSTKGTGKKYNKRLGEVFQSFKYNEEMDQALRYLFINRTVWAGRVNYDPAFESRMYYSNPGGWNIVNRPNVFENIASHICGTKITCGDYAELLRQPGDSVWVYLDPPYVVDTKLSSKSKLYEFGFTMDDHLRFVDACKNTPHKIAISYDDVPEVRNWFSKSDGFHIYAESWTYCGTTNKEKAVGKELVITNYPREIPVEEVPMVQRLGEALGIPDDAWKVMEE